jgi:hypothetical protein
MNGSTVSKHYINDPGYEVPENKILLIPHLGLLEEEDVPSYLDIVKSLKGEIKRDWFSNYFYYCLPLTIGNQYGFTIHSNFDFEATWNGETGLEGVVDIAIAGSNHDRVQFIDGNFGHGIITISHTFGFRTPPGVNLMTIQPPNIYIPGVVAMTGVVETDQLRRDFSFNLKMTDPGRTVSFKKGDVLAAFIPVPRYFIDSFDLAPASEHFDKDILANEFEDQMELNRQRNAEDLDKKFESGRKYFNGEHAFGCSYADHQKRIK